MLPPAGTELQKQFDPEHHRVIPHGKSVQVAYNRAGKALVFAFGVRKPDQLKTEVSILNISDCDSVLSANVALEVYGGKKTLGTSDEAVFTKMICEGIKNSAFDGDELIRNFEAMPFTPIQDIQKGKQVFVQGRLTGLSPATSSGGSSLIKGQLVMGESFEAVEILMFGDIRRLTCPAECVRGKFVALRGEGSTNMDGILKVVVDSKTGILLLRDEHQDRLLDTYVERYFNLARRAPFDSFITLDATPDVLKRLPAVAAKMGKNTQTEAEFLICYDGDRVYLVFFAHPMENCEYFIENGKPCYACRLAHWPSLTYGGQTLRGEFVKLKIIGGVFEDVFMPTDLFVKAAKMAGHPISGVNDMVPLAVMEGIGEYYKTSFRVRAIVGARIWEIDGRTGVNKHCEILDILSVREEDKFVNALPNVVSAPVSNPMPNPSSSSMSNVSVVDEADEEKEKDVSPNAAANGSGGGDDEFPDFDLGVDDVNDATVLASNASVSGITGQNGDGDGDIDMDDASTSGVTTRSGRGSRKTKKRHNKDVVKTEVRAKKKARKGSK